jgi:hypothetical protein
MSPMVASLPSGDVFRLRVLANTVSRRVPHNFSYVAVHEPAPKPLVSRPRVRVAQLQVFGLGE